MQFSPSPADTVAGNTDILTEILRRLPPKSLLRFKAVSREWRSLISSPFFASLHHHHPLLFGVLLHRSSKSTLEFALLHGGPHHRPNPSQLQFAGSGGDSSVTILQSSNGLLLCSARSGPHRRTFHVYNPTTGASAEVRLPSASTITPWMNLVFEPSESPHYQLIFIDPPPYNQIHRYSSATGNWSLCRNPNSNPPFNSVLAGGVYWRGSLHWLGPTSEPSLSSSLSFHLQDESFLPMPPVLRPDGDRRKRRQSILASSGGKLLLIEVYEEGEIRVLKMQEDYSSWEVWYDHISVISVISEVYPRVIGRVVEGPSSKGYYKFQVCGVVVEGEEGAAVVVLRVPGKVLGCGVGSRRVWEMREVLPSSQSASDFEWIDVFPFVETLACV